MKSNSLFLAAFAAAAVFSTGCSTLESLSPSGFRKADATASTLQDAARAANESGVQIDAVLAALSNLVQNPQGDMKPQFQQFDSALGNLKDRTDDFASNAAKMQDQGAAYFQKWDTEISAIKSENIRAQSTDRKNAVMSRFDQVRAAYQQTQNEINPFLNRLNDIRTALAADLTSAGLAAIRPAADRVTKDAPDIRDALRQRAHDFTELANSLSTQPTQ